MEIHNTPQANGLSPAPVVFNRPIRSKVVAHPTSFAPASPTEVEQAAKKNSELSRKSEDNYNLDAKELPVLDLQTFVRVQDPVTKRRSSTGKIIR